MQEVTIHSLGELIDLATPNEPEPASGRLRETSVYRGVSEPSSRLLTSLDRLGGMHPAHTKAHLEEHLLRNFLRYGRPFLPPGSENLWELMVIAEHHGLPTRLLDWTHSPIIAAHFATLSPKPGVDRIIWKLNWKKVHEHFKLPAVAFLVNDLDAILQERGFKTGWDFLNSSREGQQTFACLLDPPVVTNRLEVQSGTFTLAAAKDRTLDQLLQEAGLSDALSRFIIPADRVDYLRDQLDLCTVDERRLFPGLDGVASQLRRYYAASGNERSPIF